MSSHSDKKGARYPVSQIFDPRGKEKLDQSSPKLLKFCYEPMPIITPNFITLGQMTYEKSIIKIFYACEFWHPRGTPWAAWSWCTARPDLWMCQISCCSDNLCTRYLLPNFLDFIVSAIDKQTNKKLECGPMPNVMVALPNTGGALCSMPQSLADAHY